MLLSAISTVLTPVFRLLLFCFTAARSSVIVSLGLPSLWPSNQSSLPVPVVANRLKGLNLHQAPANRSKSSGWLSLRSRPGELASSVYSAPGTRSSTSSKTPKSRLKAAQSSCVTPESCSTLSVPSRKPFRADASCFRPLPGRLQFCPALGVFLEKNPKGAFLRRASELNVHYVEPMRGSHPLRRRPDFVQTDCHRSYHPSKQNRSPGALLRSVHQARSSIDRDPVRKSPAGG